MTGKASFAMIVATFSAISLYLCLSPSSAAPKHAATPKGESAVCIGLANDFEGASKSMAANEADGLGDDSAIRQNVREAQNNGYLEKAKMTLDLMHGNGCRLPTAAPGPERYLLSAMTCKNDQLKEAITPQAGGYTVPASCDQTKWVPDKK